MQSLVEAAARSREQDLIAAHGKELPDDSCYAGGLMRRKFSRAPLAKVVQLNPLRQRSKPLQLGFSWSFTSEARAAQ